jgi:protein-tyrosine phosphatase
MIDLHSHLLPGIDDGARDDEMSFAMAKMFLADGITTVACTPHILPGLYHNTGGGIRAAVARLQQKLTDHGIGLHLVCGADAHICPDFVPGLRSGHILSLADSRYVLVEPPHHTVPQRMENFFFDILVAGYVPILTHPERLTWINQQYATVRKLAANGVWMQITAGSVTGAFGRNAQYWADRMLDEGLVHLLATDAHDIERRIPNLSRGRDAAAKRVGETEAEHLVLTRARGVLANEAPETLPAPLGGAVNARQNAVTAQHHGASDGGRGGSRSGWLRRFFG